MVSFSGDWLSKLTKTPGANQTLARLGMALFAGGQPFQHGGSRFQNMTPFLQGAMSAIPEAKKQAKLDELHKLKTEAAKREAEEADYEKTLRPDRDWET